MKLFKFLIVLGLIAGTFSVAQADEIIEIRGERPVRTFDASGARTGALERDKIALPLEILKTSKDGRFYEVQVDGNIHYISKQGTKLKNGRKVLRSECLFAGGGVLADTKMMGARFLAEEGHNGNSSQVNGC